MLSCLPATTDSMKGIKQVNSFIQDCQTLFVDMVAGGRLGKQFILSANQGTCQTIFCNTGKHWQTHFPCRYKEILSENIVKYAKNISENMLK